MTLVIGAYFTKQTTVFPSPLVSDLQLMHVRLLGVHVTTIARGTHSEEVGQGQKVINHLNIPQLKFALVKGLGLD